MELQLRFVVRENEKEYETRKSLIGREYLEHVATWTFRPYLQFRAGEGEWFTVPVITDKEEWIKANEQVEEHNSDR